MQRLALALAVTATMLSCGSAARAQAYPGAFTVCEPLPPWYPRGWELMLRRPCVSYVYGSSYYPAAAYYPYPAAYPYRRVATYRVHHRRPYLRPGWWW